MARAGTTTATVLTRAIFSEGCKSVAAGMNPMDLRRGINAAVEKVLSYLKHHAKMISTTEEIAQVGSMPILSQKSGMLTPATSRHIDAASCFEGMPHGSSGQIYANVDGF